MSENSLDTGSSANNELVETEEKREARLDREEASRKFKAIIFVIIPMIVVFLTFTYFFLKFYKREK